MSNGFLSQEEIDSLLNGGDDRSAEASSANSNDDGLTEVEKDLLGEIGNISMGSASTALYQIINQKVNITTPVVSITNLKDIKESFETPNVVLDVEYVSGIVGRNLLVIKTDDAAVIANLMMGGDGKITSHELSEIELSAVSEAMNQMIGSSATSMATMFAREVNISPPISKIWSNKDEILTDKIAEDETIVQVSFRMTIGDLVDSNIMQVLPLPTAKKIASIMMGTEEKEEEQKVSETKEVKEEPKVQTVKEEVKAKEIANNVEQVEYSYEEPVMQRRVEPVEVSTANFEPLAPSNNVSGNRNMDLIMDVPLNVSVVLGRTKKSIRDILSLGTGSLIELETLAEEPVEVLVNGKKIAYGEVVVVDENFGVRITSIISGADRIKSLK
ncbi:MAG: flagellar motor switch phosphatase FliY [Clostridium sp.]|uniref:flagellar motor switch phosphatase FliY n=1 Tax=Clostridium sp. LY3-2 TaxID=2942482 RepID=UPI0021539119|nr:flagellar motor switch phosphatase FliY [Clostridium sp. LY3-2]MCR6513595.1 flagellar motor switch phosphatase FliY [Clostridium sp. LY3-2]